MTSQMLGKFNQVAVLLKQTETLPRTSVLFYPNKVIKILPGNAKALRGANSDGDFHDHQVSLSITNAIISQYQHGCRMIRGIFWKNSPWRPGTRFLSPRPRRKIDHALKPVPGPACFARLQHRLCLTALYQSYGAVAS